MAAQGAKANLAIKENLNPRLLAAINGARKTTQALNTHGLLAKTSQSAPPSPNSNSGTAASATSDRRHSDNFQSVVAGVSFLSSKPVLKPQDKDKEAQGLPGVEPIVSLTAR